MKILIICMAALSILLTGCAGNIVVGSGRVATESRAVSNFDGLSLSGIGEVTVTQGDSEALTVEAEENLMPYLKTQVRNGTLAISIDDRYLRTALVPTRPVRFNLSVKNLKSIDLSGAGNIQSASLKSDYLAIRISGAGALTLDHVEASDLTSTLSGVGNLKVAGQVTSQTANLSGVGGYDAGELNSRTARINVNGTGSATVWAQDNLYVAINGMGSVNYYGSPRVQQTMAGMGSIKQLANK